MNKYSDSSSANKLIVFEFKISNACVWEFISVFEEKFSKKYNLSESSIIKVLNFLFRICK
jgi:hypothetical protein